MPRTKATTDATEVWAVDLFCGVGGLTHGLKMAGIQVAAGVDLDASCKFAYETNNGAVFLNKDISKTSASALARLYPKGATRVLAGCAPCQPFSTLSQGRDPKKDDKWGLLGEFGRLAGALRPDYVTMENVPKLRTTSVFRKFVKTLRDDGYHVVWDVLFCPDYGIPQERRRLVLLASRKGEISMPAKSHNPDQYMTVKQTIGHLPPIAAGESAPLDPIHKAAGLTSINLERIRVSRPGGTWRDWDDRLLLKCHKKKKGKSYSGVYGRMRWDAPGPTVTTECYNLGSGRFGHPVQDRAMSLREAALFQTFPEDYKFVKEGEEIIMTSLGTLIGNAVPVRLGEVIGKQILAHLAGAETVPRRQQQLRAES